MQNPSNPPSLLQTLQDRLRMSSHLAISVALLLALALGLFALSPTLQTQVLKVCNVTMFAALGYWVDRTAFRGHRITPDSPPQALLRRAIIIAAAMLAGSLGV